MVTSLVGCGGGGGSSDSAPLPTLTLTSGATAAQLEGGPPFALTLSGATSSHGAIVWSLSPAVGSLSSPSSSGATYTPPAAGTLTTDTTVTVTAAPTSGSAASTQVEIRLIAFGVAATAPGGSTATPDVQPSVTFTRDVLPASLTSSSISITGPIGAVPATISASGPVASLVPTEGLVWGTRYDVRLTTQVASSVNQALPANVVFSLETPAATWVPPAPLASPLWTASAPVLASTSNRRVFATWMQDTDGTGTWNIFASLVDVQTHAAGAAVPLHPTSFPSYTPAVAANEAGDAMVVWAQNIGTGTLNVFAARFDHATGHWGGAVPIAPQPNNSAQSAQVAMDLHGNAIVVWQQYTGVGLARAVHAVRYDETNSAWEAPVPLSQADDATSPEVVVDAAGNAIAVWVQSTATVAHQVAAARWDATTRVWSALPAPFGGLPGAAAPRIAMAANGDAAMAWSRSQPNGTVALEASRFSATSGSWSPVEVFTGPGTSQWGQVQMDPTGNIVLLWQRLHGGNVFSLNAARYDATAGMWTTSPAIETLSPASFATPYTYSPTLTVDAAGHAMAFWQRDVGGNVFRLFYARFDSGSHSWSAATPLPGADATTVPQSASVGKDGSVMAGWGQAPPGTSLIHPHFALFTGY